MMKDEDDSYEDNDDSNKIPNNHYLKPLLHACGQFLSNPLSHKIVETSTLFH